jgi:uncharacterized protein with von Willebrand factor type A (vWA) domain
VTKKSRKAKGCPPEMRDLLAKQEKEDLLARQVEEDVLANVSRLGKQRYRHMTDVLAGWPGAEGYDAAQGRKAARDRAELARIENARKVAEAHVLFDAEVAAEAARLGRKLSVSAQFADDIMPGLEARGVVAGRDKIQAAVRRLKKI